MLAAPARADEPKGAEPRGESRMLAGFALLPPIRFESSMPVSAIGLSLSTKFGSDDRAVSAGGSPATSQLLAIAQSFDFSARVHPRVAWLASVGGIVAAGVGDDSFYDLGAEGGFRYRAGLTGVVARLSGGATQLAAHFVVSGLRSGRLTPPAKLVGRLVEDQELPVGALTLGGRSSETVHLSWSVAHVISRYLSAQASVGLAARFARFSGERASNAEMLTLGAALGTELGPVAAQVEIDLNADLQRQPEHGVSPLSLFEEEVPFFAAIGVYYAARRELVIGGSGGVEEAEGGRRRGVGRLELRYVF